MILSNIEILRGIEKGSFSIAPLKGMDPTQSPFNTSAIDLHLGYEINILESDAPANIDLRSGGIAKFWAQHSKIVTLAHDQPYVLAQNKLILARTIEEVDFPLIQNEPICYSARVEGRSSLARCGILVHFTAPTIHAGFRGSITLEIINLGPLKFNLYPDLAICQLIIEEVKGCPANSPNQFSGQNKAVGVVS